MKIFIIGGGEDFPSKIIQKIKINEQVWKFNGYSDYKEFITYVQNKINKIIPDLIIWMVDVPQNEKIKCIKKPKGSVLICSGTDTFIKHFDSKSRALSDLYKARGNATIFIYKKNKVIYDFELIDALGNSWTRTSNFKKIIKTIFKLYNFTLKTKRKSLKKGSRLVVPKAPSSLTYLMHINTQLIDKIAPQFEAKYFSNIKTNCTKLFPSMRHNGSFFFSARHLNRDAITVNDMVYVEQEMYYGNKKCAIDTPVQLEIYKRHPRINFIIHGHSYIKDAVTTEQYHLCGDLNGIKDLKPIIGKKGFLNLYKHGFLIYGETIEDLRNIVDKIELTPKHFEKR